MNIDTLLTIFFIAIPVAVLLIGPDDAILHRLMRRQYLRTWHYETLAVMALVAVVVIASGGSPVEWCGWAALVLAHGRLCGVAVFAGYAQWRAFTVHHRLR